MPLRLRATPPTKYRSKRCVIQGVSFHSQKEGARFIDLQRLEQSGYVRNLELQPRLDLLVPTDKGPKKIGHMTLDFKYEHAVGHSLASSTGETAALIAEWRTVYEDVKSPATRTTAYRLRKRMVEAIYGITVLET